MSHQQQPDTKDIWDTVNLRGGIKTLPISHFTHGSNLSGTDFIMMLNSRVTFS